MEAMPFSGKGLYLVGLFRHTSVTGDNLPSSVCTVQSACPANIQKYTSCTTGANPVCTVTIPGYYKMRSRFVDFPGQFVLHCHILTHEDRGMMELIEVFLIPRSTLTTKPHKNYSIPGGLICGDMMTSPQTPLQLSTSLEKYKSCHVIPSKNSSTTFMRPRTHSTSAGHPTLANCCNISQGFPSLPLAKILICRDFNVG